jgi:hypothetical protein
MGIVFSMSAVVCGGDQRLLIYSFFCEHITIRSKIKRVGVMGRCSPRVRWSGQTKKTLICGFCNKHSAIRSNSKLVGEESGYVLPNISSCLPLDCVTVSFHFENPTQH